MFYAKNISWSELRQNGDVTATFDLYSGDELMLQGLTATSSIDVIQDAIVSVSKNEEIVTNQISYEEAMGLYDCVTENSELFFE